MRILCRRRRGVAVRGLARTLARRARRASMEVVRLCASAALVLAMTAPASAATRIWDGDALGNFWTTAANWQGDVAPVAGDSLIFPAGFSVTTINDFPVDTEFGLLVFAGTYGVQGNRFVLANGITLLTGHHVTIECEISLKGVVGGNTVTMDVEVFDGQIALQNVVSGSPTLSKAGPGELALSGANTYTGPTIIEQGDIRITHASALGSATAGTFVESLGWLVLHTPTAVEIAEPLTLKSANGGAGELGAAASAVWSGPITLTGNVINNAQPVIRVSANQTLAITSAIGGTTGLMKQEAGTLAFAGAPANTYTGDTFVTKGTLLLARQASAIPAELVIGDDSGGPLADVVRLLDDSQIVGKVTITSSGWLDLGDFSEAVPELLMTGGKVTTTAIGQFVLSGPVTVNLQGLSQAVIEGRLSLGSFARIFEIIGAVSPALDVTAAIDGGPNATLIKIGSGRLGLSGANVYLGATNVFQGSLLAAHSQALGATTQGTTVVSGASISLKANVSGETLIAQTNNAAVSALYCLEQAVCTWGGPIVLQANNRFWAGDGHTLQLSGPITGAGSLEAQGGGIVELSGDNTYGGGTNVGTLVRLTTSHRIPNTGRVSLMDGGTLDLHGFSDIIGGLVGAADSSIALGGGTLTVDAPADTISYHVGLIFGTGGLVKQGAGRLDLYNALNYTGVTNVQAGMLCLGPASSLAGAVAITGGTLRGGGSIGALTGIGGRIGPGVCQGLSDPDDSSAPSVGVLTTKAMTLNVATTLSIEIGGPAAGTQHDQVKVKGAIALGNATLELLISPDLVLSTLNPIVILSNDTTDPIAGTFAGLAEGAIVSNNGKAFRITYTGGDGNDVALALAARDYYLSEGATGGFFDLDILIANPNTIAAPVTVTFLLPDGSTFVTSHEIPALRRRSISVDDFPEVVATSVSTVVRSDSGLPLVVERTMTWDSSGYGAHTEKAVGGTALNWYFAEGAQGFFSTYLLLANPGASDSIATVAYLREGAPAIVRTYPVIAKSRVTVDAGLDPELVGFSFGMHVAFDQPGVAERAMYFGQNPLWTGGHESAGVTAPSTTWFLAEGATGPFFETFILLANPASSAVEATVTFLPSTGVPVVKTMAVPALGRVTLNIEGEDAALANAAVATQVVATGPILVERAQYWPDPAPAWYEAHNSFGVTETGTKWGLADGQVGGPRDHQTYILLANPGTTEAHVTITFLRVEGEPFDKSFVVNPKSRFTVDTGPGRLVPELVNERFGAVVVSDQPIAVERAMYSNANGQLWAAGTNATGTPLP
jgi:autotransporter-associated beta strand protein